MHRKAADAQSKDARAKLSEYGLKLTPQRTAIYDLIRDSKEHPTVDQIYKRIRKQLPNISFDTVYRTMLKFSEVGLVNMTERYGENMRFDPRVDQHHHFHCIKCLKIIDFCDKGYDSIRVPKKLGRQFRIISKRVVLEGICSGCGGK